MSNDEIVNMLKRYEGRTIHEIKNMGLNNWTIVFTEKDGVMPSINFLSGTKLFVVDID